MNKVKVVFLFDGLVQLIFNDQIPNDRYAQLYSYCQCGSGLSVTDHGAALHSSIIITKDVYLRLGDAIGYDGWFDETDDSKFKALINISNNIIQNVITNHPNSRITVVSTDNEWPDPDIEDFQHPDTHLGQFYELYRTVPADEIDDDRRLRNKILNELVSKNI